MTLYIVATPIGNLGDMTYRAVEVLKSVDLILCEDTRTTKTLLTHYDINTKTRSFHTHSTEKERASIIELLKDGKDLALVSDAGTPCISDPGVLLVMEVRDQLPECVIVPIPGASAIITALSASGIPASSYTFLGFLPHKKGRETLFKSMIDADMPIVFYESVHRVEKTLASLATHIPLRQIVIARELTKIHETLHRCRLDEAVAWLEADDNHRRGEFVLVVEGGETPRDLVRRSQAAAQHVGANLIGVVLNKLDAQHDGYGYYSYQYDSYRQREEEEEAEKKVARG